MEKNIAKVEEKIIKFWEKNKIYKKVKRRLKNKKKFYFLDGPPYATGFIHVGTAMNKILKDCYLRFFRMLGYNVWDQPGYDTHGVPIEIKVEKKLGFKTKKDIEKFGIENFIKECKKFATQFIGVMSEQFKNLGVWMDWENPYLTLTNEYIEGAWYTFKKAFEKGFLFKGIYPVHVCPRCITLDTLVLTNKGWKQIGELKRSWKHHKVISYNLSKKKFGEFKILGYMETKDEVVEIKSESGLSIKATFDHPFLTPNGWKLAKELNKGDKIAVARFSCHTKKDMGKHLKGKVIFEKILNIRNLGKRKVADIKVEKVSNFIANSFVTHNCETAVAYNEIVYKNIEDLGIYVKFRVLEEPNTFLLIYTTTPWTLPSNTGIMVHPEAIYVKVKVGNEVWIVAERLVENLMKKFGVSYKLLRKIKGKELVDLKYFNPIAELFPFTQKIENAYRVVESERYVNVEEGTGLVHCAPGHGKEDFEVGKENGLPAINPLKIDGTFNEESGKFAGIFAKDADELIIKELKKRGVLVKVEKIRHEYPLCWRCESPLLLMTIPQWFFRVTQIRKKLLEENEKINWVPKWAKLRFKNWLESLGDWPISRQRYWGIPLPIWVCGSCGNIQIIGSRKELPKIIKDFHRPHIDKIIWKCGKCKKGLMKRVPDVLDVWFDSGVAPWASLNYPRNKKLFKKLWPVDFVLEGSDQIRGWWNSLLITSILTFGEKSFKNVLYHGFVLDAHGKQMSKSLGNIVTPEEVIEKYGRDVLRFYYLSLPPWQDYYFKWKDIEKIARDFVVLRNVFRFVDTYVTKTTKKPKNLKKEDKWILSRLNSLISKATEEFLKFYNYKAAQMILDFALNDFSRWYIKLVRDRVWIGYDGKDKDAAFYTLSEVSKKLLLLLAPFTPFLSEYFYQKLKNRFVKKKKSVYFESWPRSNKKAINKKLENEMKIIREIFESVAEARQKAKIKLRWPVENIIILTKRTEIKNAVKNLKSVLKNIGNVKRIEVGEKAPKNLIRVEFENGEVFLNPVLSRKLLEEALVNELTRKIQQLRKENKFKVKERILLTLNSDEKTNKLLEKYSKKISLEVGAESLIIGEIRGKFKGELKFRDKTIKIGFQR